MISKWGFNMYIYFGCIASGIWHFYNFVTYIHPEWMLPYFRLAGDASPLLRVVNMLCLNWSPIIGTLLIAFGVIGIKFNKSTDVNFETFKWFMFLFALLTAVGLML